LSCNSNPAAQHAPKAQRRQRVNPDSIIRFFTVENKRFMSLDTLRFLIPDGFNVSPANIYNGIYEVKPSALVRHKVLISNNLVFFTTFEDLGKGIRAYLYAFDISRKSFIRDSSFSRNYLFSGAGIFVIDPYTSRIFAVDRSVWYNAKRENIIPASVFEVKDGRFQITQNLYQIANEPPVDTALLSFFKKFNRYKWQGSFHIT
jgi:hypothetical protein